MSAYIKLATGEYPRFEGDIRLEYPEITEDQTWPNFPCPDTYAPVQWVDEPVVDPATQTYAEGPPELVDGTWYMTWVVRNWTQEELDQIAANIAAAGDVNGPGTAPDVVG
jgi:hypothetical protein